MRIRRFTKFPVCVTRRDRNPERDSESFVRDHLSQMVQWSAGFESYRGSRRPTLSPSPDENGKLIRRVNSITAFRGHSWIRTTNPARRNPLCGWRRGEFRETDEGFHKLIRSPAIVDADVTFFVSHVYFLFQDYTPPLLPPLRSSLAKFFIFRVPFPRNSTATRFESPFLLVYLSSFRYHGSCPPRRARAMASLSNRHNNSVRHS